MEHLGATVFHRNAYFGVINRCKTTSVFPKSVLKTRLAILHCAQNHDSVLKTCIL